MQSTEFTRWGWLSGRECTPQDEVFPTPDAAIAAMQKRLGGEPPLEKIAELGFKLALLRVALAPVMVLESVVAGGSPR